MKENILKPDDFLLSVNEEDPSPENVYIFASNSKKLFIKQKRCKKSEMVKSSDQRILVWKEFYAEFGQTCHEEAYDFIFGHLYGAEFYSDEMDETLSFDFEDSR